MNKLDKRLAALTSEQRNLIIKLGRENQRLKVRNQFLSNRIQDLEQINVVIDREIAEIPIGFDLIPEDDLNKY